MRNASSKRWGFVGASKPDSGCLKVLFGLGLALLTGCVSTVPAQQVQPRLLNGSEAGGAIVSGPDMRPKRVAIAHCAQYKKHAVLRDVQRVGESVVTKWDKRAYIVYFDCM